MSEEGEKFLGKRVFELQSHVTALVEVLSELLASNGEGDMTPEDVADMFWDRMKQTHDERLIELEDSVDPGMAAYFADEEE